MPSGGNDNHPVIDGAFLLVGTHGHLGDKISLKAIKIGHPCIGENLYFSFSPDVIDQLAQIGPDIPAFDGMMQLARHAAEFSGWGHDAVLYRVGTKKPRQYPGEPNIFEIEDRAFLRAVAKEDPSCIKCDYFDGLRTLEFTLAVDRAMSTGRIAKLGM